MCIQYVCVRVPREYTIYISSDEQKEDALASYSHPPLALICRLPKLIEIDPKFHGENFDQLIFFDKKWFHR